MNVVGIIPARMGSTRFPNKPLAPILGMPMIGHCYHRTRLALGETAAYVTTCDTVIADYVSRIGGRPIMTSKNHTRATTRSAEAVELIEADLGLKVDIVVMVQGDEPLIDPQAIKDMLAHFDDPTVEIVNIMSKIASTDQFLDKNNVKVVVNKKNDALYFSREGIPSIWTGTDGVPMYMQTGIIAFRRDTLVDFNKLPESRLEQIESVDMNRVLENCGSIRMVLTNTLTIGVDTPAELDLAEEVMKQDPVAKKYLAV